MHRRRLLTTIGTGAVALSGCSAPGTDGESAPPDDGTPTGTGPPAIEATVVDDSYLRVSHAGGERLAAGGATLYGEFRVAGFVTESIEHRLDTDFGPGDALFVSRTPNAAVAVTRTPPEDPLPLERLASLSLRRQPAGTSLFRTDPLAVGVSPVSASFSGAVVDDVLIRITHEGGDPLLPGQTAVIIQNDSPSGRSFSRRRLETRFAPGDQAWIYVDLEFQDVFLIGPKPEYDYPMTGTTEVTFVDPFGDAIGSVTAEVGR